MRTGTGVGMLAAGAVLYWAVDVDLPFVADDALGVILMVAGAVAVGVSLVAATRTSRNANGAGAATGAGAGLGLLLAGAILLWAVDVDLPFLDDEALGVVLIIGGLVALAASVIMHLQQSRARHVVEYRYK